MKAHETHYGGYDFRSRLEAQWAVFFDALGIKWAYEPNSFHTMAGSYLPDFQLIDGKRKIFVEVKPGWPHTQEQNKCIALAQKVDGAMVFFCCGKPGAETIVLVEYRAEYQTYMLDQWLDSNHGFWVRLHGCTELDVILAYHKASTTL